jgi:hypothetical protein
VLFDKGGREQARVVLDADDAALVMGYRWSAVVTSHATYADGVLSCDRSVRRYMHRLITAAPEWADVDHIDGDGLNNRRSNLKVVSHKENLENRRLESRNTSGYRGVTWSKTRAKWLAVVMHDGEAHHVGAFDDVHEAGRAAHEARERLFTNHQTREPGR